MEVSLRITPLARQEIIEIAEHIAQDSLKAADSFLDAVEAACTRLTLLTFAYLMIVPEQEIQQNPAGTAAFCDCVRII